MAAAFVDSNVLIYSVDAGDAMKCAMANRWLARLWADGAGCITVQVVNEFYWNATRKIDTPISRARAQGEARRYLPWVKVPIDAALLATAWQHENRSQLAWWDALIVAAAQRANCSWLLTEDLEDGQRFDELVVVDPFRHAPEEILDGGAGRVSEAGPSRRRAGRSTRSAAANPAIRVRRGQ